MCRAISWTFCPLRLHPPADLPLTHGIAEGFWFEGLGQSACWLALLVRNLAAMSLASLAQHVTCGQSMLHGGVALTKSGAQQHCVTHDPQKVVTSER